MKKIIVSESHSFHVALAVEIGLEEAIILKDLHYIINSNRGKEHYERDGKVWTYITLENFTKRFPYMNKTKIWRTLAKLEEEGYIIKGEYNKISYDKTTWYSLSDKTWEIFSGNQVEVDFIQEQIPEKKQTAKRVVPKIRPKVEPKWGPFLDFIEGEFAIMYPAHKNKALTIKTGYEFAEDPTNYMMTAEEISELITKIKSHYLGYCTKHGTYAVGPKRYLEDRKWTEEVNTFNKNTGATQEDHKGLKGIEIIKQKLRNKE